MEYRTGEEVDSVTHAFKVLVTDDDPIVLELTSSLLRQAGYEVLQATTGQECLETVRTHHPDLIILDVMLPDVTGTDICRKVKSDPDLQGSFVILLSGVHISSNQQAEGLSAGADGYLVKPVSRKEFIARVQAMERIKRAEDALRETKKEQEATIQELRKALEEIKTLRGLIPICAWCKRIRDDAGYWDELEVYLGKHSEATFSHGLCPRCREEVEKGMKGE